MLERSLGISLVNGLAQGLERLECLADRVIGIASLFIESEPRFALVGHLLSERRQCRRYPAAIRVPVENLVHAIPQRHGTLLGLVEGLPGSDRIGRQDLFGLGGLGGDAVDLRLVRDRGQPLLFHLLDPGQDFPLADDHDVGRRPSILVGLVELIHAGRALLGLDLDLLEDLGVGDELLGFLQFLGPQRGVFLGQRLGLVQSVHDLQPAIPEPGEVSLDLLVHREGLAADRLLEVRIFNGQFLEPRLQSIEPVHDVDSVLLVLLDLRLHRVAGPVPSQPDQGRDDQTDREQRGHQGENHLILDAGLRRLSPCLRAQRPGRPIFRSLRGRPGNSWPAR